MPFTNQKKSFLMKTDKSRKGSIDYPIRKLIKKINNSVHYYSTSSCSGRTLLLVRAKSKKHEAQWLYVTHSIAKFDQIKSIILNFLKNKNNEKVYFRFEPAIFHICCDTIDNAQQLVNIARDCGFRRSGIQSTNKRIIVEVSSSEMIEAIVVRNGKLLVNDAYLKELILEVNNKQKQNKDKIKKLDGLIIKEK